MLGFMLRLKSEKKNVSLAIPDQKALTLKFVPRCTENY